VVKINPISNYAVSPDVLVLRNLLQRTLETTVAIFESYNVPLPLRQYWCLGQAAEDCAQVTVVYTGGYLGLPGGQQSEPQACNGPKSATILINITRDLPQGPNGNPATPTQIQEASDWGAIDAWVLLSELRNYDLSSLGTPGAGVTATVTVAPPSGFVQTTTLTLTQAVL